MVSVATLLLAYIRVHLSHLLLAAIIMISCYPMFQHLCIQTSSSRIKKVDEQRPNIVTKNVKTRVCMHTGKVGVIHFSLFPEDDVCKLSLCI